MNWQRPELSALKPTLLDPLTALKLLSVAADGVLS
jgi:hypothetical protein